MDYQDSKFYPDLNTKFRSLSMSSVFEDFPDINCVVPCGATLPSEIFKLYSKNVDLSGSFYEGDFSDMNASYPHDPSMPSEVYMRYSRAMSILAEQQRQHDAEEAERVAAEEAEIQRKIAFADSHPDFNNASD